MCGISGLVLCGQDSTSAATLVAETLMQLQHRGQDGWGIASSNNMRLYDKRAQGLIKDSMTAQSLEELPGGMSVGQVRYATQGSAKSIAYTQPFVGMSTFNLVLVHNGNIVNTNQLRQEYAAGCETQSDSEALLRCLSTLVDQGDQTASVSDRVFAAVGKLMQTARGAYSVIVLVQGHGMIAFRDPHGTRPLCMAYAPGGRAFVSESCAIAPLAGFRFERNVMPGEAVWVSCDGDVTCKQLSNGDLRPCAFEFVYLARKSSVIDGVSVHQARVNMGVELAQHIRETIPDYAERFDRVVSVPETADSCAQKMARELGIHYRTGFDKNTFVGRSFMQPSQTERDRAVWRKLQPVTKSLRGYRVLLTDDSVVRGTTSRQIATMVRQAGAREVHMVSASPPVRFPNHYGIAMATKEELIANGRDEEAIAKELGLDSMTFLPLDGMVNAIMKENEKLHGLETSCFTGKYPMGLPDYL